MILPAIRSFRTADWTFLVAQSLPRIFAYPDLRCRVPSQSFAPILIPAMDAGIITTIDNCLNREEEIYYVDII
jgi:hypothetical protein